VSGSATTLYQRPVELLQQLLRFDTSNPPGNEAACIAHISRLLTSAGLQTRFVARDSKRPNLIARVPGAGRAPPLLLHGHVDVFPTKDQQWRHPPFEGRIVDGHVWGRGALDMKSGVAMFIAAVLRATAEKVLPSGDVVLAILSDEECGGHFGSRYLVERHPELFAGIRYAISEFGGFSIDFAGRRFYPIQVAEKQKCWLRAKVRQADEGGSTLLRNDGLAELASFLQRIDQERLPVHVTPVVREMVEAIGDAFPFGLGKVLKLLLHPRIADRTLGFLGKQGARFDLLLRNAVDPGSGRIKVESSRATAEFVARPLPGFSPDDVIGELRAFAGEFVELELLRHDPPPREIDMGLYSVLARVMRETDPEGTPVPFVLTRGQTDARFFAGLGIQTYGFLPMHLPPNLNFTKLIHAADERIPAEALDSGSNAIFKALQRFHGVS
jgi:acetylornithine deacetylase/succinyl-diaminopimelate desuccinylase-like protein